MELGKGKWIYFVFLPLPYSSVLILQKNEIKNQGK